jgi:transcriptional regulator with XRE-family HTH domain
MKQGKNKIKSSNTFERLDRIRVATGQTWEQIAQQLNVDRSMLFHVKAERRNLSAKALFRLEQMEQVAGVGSPTDTGVFSRDKSTGKSSPKLLERITTHPELSTLKVTAEDVDRGFICIPVQYRRGEPPPGYSDTVKINALTGGKAAQVFVDFLIEEDVEELLIKCLPERHANKEFLRQVAPTTFANLFEAALSLTFGVNWRKNMPNLSEKMKARRNS